MSAQKNHSTHHMVAAGEGKSLVGGFALYKLLGEETGGAFALIEHKLGPHALAAPLHTHRHEDEASFVLEGEIGFQIGEDVFSAGVGSLVVKPKGIAHTFWNLGEHPARVLEVIWPAGFERYFEDLDSILSASGPPDMARIQEVAARYGLTMDMESVPLLLQEHDLVLSS